jgi:hypothetical protein
MHLPAHAILLAAIVPGLAAVKFTKPDVDKRLNLSADTITIAWVVEGGTPEATQYQSVDIWWQGPGFGYQLASDFPAGTVGTSEFAWKPKNVSDALLSTGTILPTDKKFYFETKFHEKNSSAGASIKSENYAVEGYPKIGAAGSSQPEWGIGLAGSLLAGIVTYLL